MAKYLDYAGLQYLWTKIKNYVSTQPLGANVRYDAQTLTTAQQAQARKNIAAGGFNYNILDNSWFQVNSRNWSSTDAGTLAYTVDRWRKGTNGKAEKLTNGIRLSTPSSNELYLTQLIPSDIRASLTGKQVTFSVYVANVTGTWRLGGLSLGNLLTNLSAGINYVTATVTNNTNTEFNISTAQSGASIDVIAAKLELGSYSTLGQDVMPDYGEELTRCIYSTADPSDTYANNGFGRTNPNLLDNPWWGSGEAINQRDTQSKPSNGSYTIDRWILTSGADANQWAIGANGITFTIASSSIWYTQRTPNPSAWSGKTLTASVLLSDGTIKSGSAAFTYGTAAIFYNDSALNLSMNTSGQFVLAIRSTQTIRAVKLELGSVSTLANDTPPDYVTELHKCEAYYKHIGGIRWAGYGMALNNAQIRFCITFPKMAKTPTSGIITTPKFYYNNAWTAASSYAVTDYDTSYVMFVINVSQTLTTGSSYLLQADNIQISADL